MNIGALMAAVIGSNLMMSECTKDKDDDIDYEYTSVEELKEEVDIYGSFVTIIMVILLIISIVFFAGILYIIFKD